MTVERDVIMRLRVQPADGRAMADLAARAKETEKALSGGSKAIRDQTQSIQQQARAEADKIAQRRQLSKATEAELAARGLDKKGDPASGAAGGAAGGALGKGLLAATAGLYALAHVAANSRNSLDEYATARTDQGRQNAALRAIPGVGPIGVELGQFIRDLREGRHNDRAYAANLDRLSAVERGNIPLQRTGRELGYDIGHVSAAEQERQARQRFGPIDAELARAQLARGARPESLEELARLDRAQGLRKSALEDLYAAEMKVYGVERDRIEGQKQLAELPVYERQRAVQTANLLDKGGLQALSKEQLGLVQGVGLFQPLLERERLKTLQEDRGGFIKQAADINVRADIDERALAAELGKRLEGIYSRIEVTLGNQIKVNQAQAESERVRRQVLTDQGR